MYNQTLNMSLLKYFPKYINRPELYLSIKIGKNMESFHDLFFLAAKFMCAPGAIKAEQNTSSTRRNIQQLEPQNIREPILDFTARFGRNKPRHALSLQMGSVGAPKGCFCLFPSVRRESMKKNVKSSIFRKKNK